MNVHHFSIDQTQRFEFVDPIKIFWENDVMDLATISCNMDREINRDVTEDVDMEIVGKIDDSDKKEDGEKEESSEEESSEEESSDEDDEFDASRGGRKRSCQLLQSPNKRRRRTWK